MASLPHFRSSKLSQRIFALFIVSAVIPVVAIAVISYHHVADQLREQSYEQSRQNSKTIGMELFGRLSQARDHFDIVAQTLSDQRDAGRDLIEDTLGRLEPRFGRAVLIRSGHVVSGDAGLMRLIPVTDAGLAQYLVNGRTRILITDGVDAAPQILLLARLDQDDPTGGMLIASLDQSFLWEVTDLLPGGTELIVLSGKGAVLFTNEVDYRMVLDPLKKRRADSISGHFIVKNAAGAHTHLVSYWTLFTSGEFGLPDWVIAVCEPEGQALAALERFRRVYFPVLVLVVLLVSYFAVLQIRKRIMPLKSLIDVTEKVAHGDFSERIDVNGDDEIAQLGESFNVMARRLDRQFSSLEALAEIDHVILASFDIRHIISLALEHAHKLTDCNAVAMITFDNNDGSEDQCIIRLTGSGAEIQMDQPALDPADMAELLDGKDCLITAGERPFPGYIHELVYDGCHTLLLIPMIIKGNLAAVIMFAYSGQQRIGEDERNLLCKYADRIDVALSNARWEGRMYQQVHYDPLTGLPNRILLIDRLGQALTRARQDDGCAALFFIDVDRFKVINDSLGHSAGDLLLKSIAMNLVANIRDIDTVVRFGGDEFVVVIPDLKNDERALVSLQSYATRLISVIHQDVDINGINLVPEASLGIAVYPQNGTDFETLIKNADAAMHFAKEQGRNQYSFYSPELNRETLQRLQLEQELRRAIDNGELRLFYQPKVSADGRVLIGAEALVRWQHPEHGIILPSEFIGLAEESGLIDDMSLWVLRTACLQIREWRNRGLAPLCISINLSSCHFSGGEAVADQVLQTLDECGLDGSALEVEITETTLIADDVGTTSTMKKLRDSGVGIAIDDFGTGYSSLSYLHKLPVDKIKIDKSFTMAMVDNHDARAIVASTIALAHELRFKVVAEGVETAEAQELLMQWSCDELQGYYFSRPLPVTEFEELLHRYMIAVPAGREEGRDSGRSSSA